jgi:hypothetical protein
MVRCDDCGIEMPSMDIGGGRILYEGIVCLSCGKVQCKLCKGNPMTAACKYCGSEVKPAYAHYLSNKTKSSSCFVATAVFGSGDALQVISLRRFRDNYLTYHRVGRAFISFYNSYGPKLAVFVNKSKGFKLICKYIITIICSCIRFFKFDHE